MSSSINKAKRFTFGRRMRKHTKAYCAYPIRTPDTASVHTESTRWMLINYQTHDKCLRMTLLLAFFSQSAVQRTVYSYASDFKLFGLSDNVAKTNVIQTTCTVFHLNYFLYNWIVRVSMNYSLDLCRYRWIMLIHAPVFSADVYRL